MSGRFWLFIGALLGGLAVAAGAIGAHALGEGVGADARRIYDVGQRYHALHAVALVAVAIIMLQTEGRRARFASWLLQASAVAFLAGLFCFSGGLYVQAIRGWASNGGVVPLGGLLFMTGWAALAFAAFGLRK